MIVTLGTGSAALSTLGLAGADARTQAEAAHFPLTPTQGVNAIIDELALRLAMRDGGAGVEGGAGCVRTIKRYADQNYDLASIDNLTQSGLPAMLVACMGGPFRPFDTVSGWNFEHALKFAIICAAGRFSSQKDRISGDEPTIDPGAEELLDWATYFGVRALYAARFKKIRPISHLWLRIEPERYVAVAELEAVRLIDCYDDGPYVFLERIGLVHNPSNPERLFRADNETPNTDAPPTANGGVTGL